MLFLLEGALKPAVLANAALDLNAAIGVTDRNTFLGRWRFQKNSLYRRATIIGVTLSLRSGVTA